MSQSYCGNECGGCERKEQHNCPGCRVGPGQKYGTTCDIAKCAIGMNVSNCDDCRDAQRCAKRKRRVSAAVDRVIDQQRQTQSLQKQVEVSGLLSQGLTSLLWLLAVNLVLNLVCLFLDYHFNVEFFSVISAVVICLAQAMIFLKISMANINFRVVAILSFVSAALAVLNLFVEGPLLILVVSLSQLGATVAIEYLQFLGYTVVTEEYKSNLSQKWNNLCVAHFVLLIVFGLALMVFLMGLTVAGLLALLAMLGYIVTSILKIIRLVQTAMFFKGYHEEIQRGA